MEDNRDKARINLDKDKDKITEKIKTQILKYILLIIYHFIKIKKF